MTASLRVLGVDPGLTRCGVGIVDVAPDRSARLVHFGVIRSAADAPIEQRLATIARGLREIVAEHRPAVVAVERVFTQQNLHTVMGTAQASGIALLVAAESGLSAATHTPTEVKAAITGYGSATRGCCRRARARALSRLAWARHDGAERSDDPRTTRVAGGREIHAALSVSDRTKMRTPLGWTT